MQESHTIVAEMFYVSAFCFVFVNEHPHTAQNTKGQCVVKEEPV